MENTILRAVEKTNYLINFYLIKPRTPHSTGKLKCKTLDLFFLKLSGTLLIAQFKERTTFTLF